MTVCVAGLFLLARPWLEKLVRTDAGANVVVILGMIIIARGI